MYDRYVELLTNYSNDARKLFDDNITDNDDQYLSHNISPLKQIWLVVFVLRAVARELKDNNEIS